MKRKLLSILLTLTMIATMMPAMATISFAKDDENGHELQVYKANGNIAKDGEDYIWGNGEVGAVNTLYLLKSNLVVTGSTTDETIACWAVGSVEEDATYIDPIYSGFDLTLRNVTVNLQNAPKEPGILTIFNYDGEEFHDARINIEGNCELKCEKESGYAIFTQTSDTSINVKKGSSLNLLSYGACLFNDIGDIHINNDGRMDASINSKGDANAIFTEKKAIFNGSGYIYAKGKNESAINALAGISVLGGIDLFAESDTYDAVIKAGPSIDIRTSGTVQVINHGNEAGSLQAIVCEALNIGGSANVIATSTDENVEKEGKRSRLSKGSEHFAVVQAKNININTQGTVKITNLSDNLEAGLMCEGTLQIGKNTGKVIIRGGKGEKLAIVFLSKEGLALHNNILVYGSVDANAVEDKINEKVIYKEYSGAMTAYVGDKCAKSLLFQNKSEIIKDVISSLKGNTTYTVKFDMQGHGDAVHEKYVIEGFKIHSKPDTSQAAGYVFGGWYKDASCTQEWKWDEDVITADLTLYAKWISIDVAKTSIKNLKAGKKSFTVKVKKVAGAEKYQVKYSIKKNMKSAAKNSMSTVTKTVKNLKAKKTYYVQVRALKKIEGKTYYSAWSKAKKVKTK